MPALPPVAGVIKVELLWTQNGIPCANVLHCSYTGGPPVVGELNTITSDIAAALTTDGLLTAFTSSTVFVGVKCTDLSSDTGVVSEYSDGRAGTYEGAASPAQAAVLVNQQLTRRYRGGHPRIYWPPPTSVYLESASAWDSTAVTAYQDYMTALWEVFGTITVGSTTLAGACCVSYVTAGAPRVDPLVEPLTGFIVSPILGTQRRRVRASSF